MNKILNCITLFFVGFGILSSWVIAMPQLDTGLSLLLLVWTAVPYLPLIMTMRRDPQAVGHCCALNYYDDPQCGSVLFILRLDLYS